MDELTQQSPYEIGVDFKYIKTLARGGFGTVIHVTEISTNKDMAIKVINKYHNVPHSVTTGLRAAKVEAELWDGFFKVDAIVDTPYFYLISGTRL